LNTRLITRPLGDLKRQQQHANYVEYDDATIADVQKSRQITSKWVKYSRPWVWKASLTFK